MNWSQGDFVLHKSRPEWGVGKVLDVNTSAVQVFFVNAGKRLFEQPAGFLETAPEGAKDHPLLAHIAPAVLNGSAKFLSLAECISRFQRLFPDGFQDSGYLSTDPKKGERNYKVQASQLARSLLAKSDWTDLASQRRYGEICQRLSRVESATNLLHTIEKIKWHAALNDERLQKQLADALYDDIYGSGSRISRFDALVKALSHCDGCAKWPTATYYGFLLEPKSRIFIKPEVTKFAAEACGWDLQYDSVPNWNTLSRAEALAQYLFDSLTALGMGPRDMIDVQSFIWCIDPKSYG